MNFNHSGWGGGGGKGGGGGVVVLSQISLMAQVELKSESVFQLSWKMCWFHFSINI